MHTKLAMPREVLTLTVRPSCRILTSSRTFPRAPLFPAWLCRIVSSSARSWARLFPSGVSAGGAAPTSAALTPLCVPHPSLQHESNLREHHAAHQLVGQGVDLLLDVVELVVVVLEVWPAAGLLLDDDFWYRRRGSSSVAFCSRS